MTEPPPRPGAQPTRSVAFFRNMNLGQARSKSPTRPVLEGAFTAAGATGVRSFQTNGTVLFSTEAPDEVIARVRTALQQATGYADIAPVQPLAAVIGLVGRTRGLLGAVDAAVCGTFFEAGEASADAAASGVGTSWALPGAVLDGVGTVVLASGPGWVVTRVAPGGDPTTAVQAQLRRKATTRAFGTLERLVRVAG